MSDIFISYASDDRPKAEALANALEQYGWSVWWDRSIPPGTFFDEVIKRELDAAKCVLVLWSAKSVQSRWVKAEARVAAEREQLIPIHIEAGVVIPWPFGEIQSLDLARWNGQAADGVFVTLGDGITRVIGAPAGVGPGHQKDHINQIEHRSEQVPPLAEVRTVQPSPSQQRECVIRFTNTRRSVAMQMRGVMTILKVKATLEETQQSSKGVNELCCAAVDQAQGHRIANFLQNMEPVVLHFDNDLPPGHFVLTLRRP